MSSRVANVARDAEGIRASARDLVRRRVPVTDDDETIRNTRSSALDVPPDVGRLNGSIRRDMSTSSALPEAARRWPGDWSGAIDRLRP